MKRAPVSKSLLLGIALATRLLLFTQASLAADTDWKATAVFLAAWSRQSIFGSSCLSRLFGSHMGGDSKVFCAAPNTAVRAVSLFDWRGECLEFSDRARISRQTTPRWQQPQTSSLLLPSLSLV